ncbi:MAG: hypothetical protein K2Q12_01110 [Rickettsiales bacterium]|nr:hypothetical protein [Rickettsiales bacterium]
MFKQQIVLGEISELQSQVIVNRMQKGESVLVIHGDDSKEKAQLLMHQMMGGLRKNAVAPEDAVTDLLANILPYSRHLSARTIYFHTPLVKENQLASDQSLDVVYNQLTMTFGNHYDYFFFDSILGEAIAPALKLVQLNRCVVGAIECEQPESGFKALFRNVQEHVAPFPASVLAGIMPGNLPEFPAMRTLISVTSKKITFHDILGVDEENEVFRLGDLVSQT